MACAFEIFHGRFTQAGQFAIRFLLFVGGLDLGEQIGLE